MLVALPHLSNLLSSTFIPPNPSSLSSLYINNQSQQHPLLPIYQRLMDIRFRCNAQTALCILEKVSFFLSKDHFIIGEVFCLCLMVIFIIHWR